MKKRIYSFLCAMIAVFVMMPSAFAQEDTADIIGEVDGEIATVIAEIAENGEDVTGIIGGADGPTSIYVTDSEGNSKTYTIDDNGAVTTGESEGTALLVSEEEVVADGEDAVVSETENNEDVADENSEGEAAVSDGVTEESEQIIFGEDDPFIIKLYGGGILNLIPMGEGTMNVVITLAMYILCALIAYALGSLNFALVISKLFYHDDIRKYGSGNAGTTNMLRTYGKGAAIGTILGDALKVVFAILIGNCIVGALFGGGYIAGFFAVLGHVYPIYYKFKGGKGVVASAITILMLDWRVFLVVIGVFVAVVAIWRYISLGSILSAAIYPMVTYAAAISDGRPAGIDFLFALVLAVFVIILHRTNIQRLIDGKENKLSFKKKDKKPADTGNNK